MESLSAQNAPTRVPKTSVSRSKGLLKPHRYPSLLGFGITHRPRRGGPRGYLFWVTTYITDFLAGTAIPKILHPVVTGMPVIPTSGDAKTEVDVAEIENVFSMSS